MNLPLVLRLGLLTTVVSFGLQVGGCRVGTPGTGGQGTPEPGGRGAEATAGPVSTGLPPAAGESATPPRPGAGAPLQTASPGPGTPEIGSPEPGTPESGTPGAATAVPGATAGALLPPGEPLPEDAWRTLVKAPGLPDMDPVPELGASSQFAVVTGNEGLNTLRSELRQPSNAWIAGVPTDTLLVGTFLGQRRGDGHDLEIVGLAVEGATVNVAVRLTAPGEWLGGGTVYPLHLIALRRSALPAGPLAFHFLDAAALGPAAREPAFDVALEALDPATDLLARKDALILQTANAGTPTPGATPGTPAP